MAIVDPPRIKPGGTNKIIKDAPIPAFPAFHDRIMAIRPMASPVVARVNKKKPQEPSNRSCPKFISRQKAQESPAQ